jgi:hypothetical protein
MAIFVRWIFDSNERWRLVVLEDDGTTTISGRMSVEVLHALIK